MNQEIHIKPEYETIRKWIERMELLKSICEKHLKKYQDKRSRQRSPNRADKSWVNIEAIAKLEKTIIYYKNLENENNTNV